MYKLIDLFVLNTSFLTCFDEIQVNLLAKIGNFLLTKAKRRCFYTFLIQFDENSTVSRVRNLSKFYIKIHLYNAKSCDN